MNRVRCECEFDCRADREFGAFFEVKSRNDDDAVSAVRIQMQMNGFIRNDHNTVRVANRIFEMRLYNYFLSDEEIRKNLFSRDMG